LREIRKRLDLSQQELAERFKHIPAPPYPGLISRYEQGIAEPSLLVLLEYAHLAGVAMDTLVDDKQDLPKK
jgi:transcriptional regulator with XRE-family HTH domain